MTLPANVQAMIKELEFQRDSYAARCVVLQAEAALRAVAVAALQSELEALRAKLAAAGAPPLAADGPPPGPLN